MSSKPEPVWVKERERGREGRGARRVASAATFAALNQLVTGQMRVQIHSPFAIKAPPLKRAHLVAQTVPAARMCSGIKIWFHAFAHNLVTKREMCVTARGGRGSRGRLPVLAMCAAWFLSHANKRELQTRGDMWSLRWQQSEVSVGQEGVAKPKAATAAAADSQSVDRCEWIWGWRVSFYLFFFLLFWRLCKGDESWSGEGGGGEGKITKATCIWRLAALSAARRENCWLNLM